jgi:hypothetical protein
MHKSQFVSLSSTLWRPYGVSMHSATDCRRPHHRTYSASPSDRLRSQRNVAMFTVHNTVCWLYNCPEHSSMWLQAVGCIYRQWIRTVSTDSGLYLPAVDCLWYGKVLDTDTAFGVASGLQVGRLRGHVSICGKSKSFLSSGSYQHHNGAHSVTTWTCAEALFPAVKLPGRVAHSWFCLLSVLRMHVDAIKISHTDYFAWVNLTFTFYATF